MQVHGRLTALASADALRADKLPSRLKILGWGRQPTRKGEIAVSPLTVESLPVRQQSEGWDRIALDFEHNTVPGTPEYERSQEPRAVAAYGVVVCSANDGVYLDDIQWTPQGEQFARSFCDLSPVVVLTRDGTVVGVHSVALCRHGAVDGLSAFSVDVPEKGDAKGDASMQKLIAMLRRILGKSETASEDELIQGVEERLSAPAPEVVAMTAEVKVLRDGIAGLRNELGSIRADLGQRDRDAILRDAAAQGKVVALTAEAAAKLSLDELRAHVAALPATVPIEQRTPTHLQPLSVDAVPASIDRVARACGMDPKKVTEHSRGRLAMVAVLAFCLLGVGRVQADALTDNVSTPERSGELVSYLVTSGSVIYAGSLVCEAGTGYVLPAADASGYMVVGKATEKVDNSGSNYSATKSIIVKRGVFRWTNGDSFTDANVGDLAYVEDDQTVQKGSSATYDIVAGIIIDVDTDGVWVDTYAIGGQGAASVTTLSASGAVTLGSTASVAGLLSTAAGITDTDANGASTISAIGFEANDAVLVLDADQGDDNADTWSIESEAADNDLSVVNHATEQFKVTATGDAKSTGDLHALGGEVYLGTVGYFSVVNTTQLVFVASGVTNELDSDITH